MREKEGIETCSYSAWFLGNAVMATPPGQTDVHTISAPLWVFLSLFSFVRITSIVIVVVVIVLAKSIHQLHKDFIIYKPTF